MVEGCERGKSFEMPPVLAGYAYSVREAFTARDDKKILSLRIETNNTCNLNCRYCYNYKTEKAEEIDYSLLHTTILQAKELGAKSIVIGGGETTLYSGFRKLIELINNNRMLPVVITNAISVNNEMARFLYDHNCSVMAKLDSLHPSTQDLLAGLSGAYVGIQAGLHNLLNAGFSKSADPLMLRLGISFVVNSINIAELEEIWHFCRRHHVLPNLNILSPVGKAKQFLEKNKLSSEQVSNYKLKLLSIDREDYGYDWLPYTPVAAGNCLQSIYSLYITAQGNVRPCALIRFDQHPFFFQNGIYPYNLLKKDLQQIYHSEPFVYVRNLDKQLEGKCMGCENLDECIGCKEYAYNTGIDKGLDPFEALRMECQKNCNYSGT